MTIEEFTTQIERLKGTFGDRSYPKERVKLIWRAVSDLSLAWLEKTTDALISTSKFPPLPGDFSSFVLDERDRLWEIQKRINAKEAKDFWADTLAPSESSHICQMIKRRARGAMSDDEWNSFQRMLKTIRVTSPAPEPASSDTPAHLPSALESTIAPHPGG
jgi:hypothetical protein